MKILSLILRELLGIFIDDEFLAIAVLAVVGLAAACTFLFAIPPIAVGAVLLIGCIAVLVSSVVKASRKAYSD